VLRSPAPGAAGGDGGAATSFDSPHGDEAAIAEGDPLDQFRLFFWCVILQRAMRVQPSLCLLLLLLLLLLLRCSSASSF